MRTTNTTIPFILMFAIIAGCHGRRTDPAPVRPVFDPAFYRSVVESLAASEMQGRGVTTQGIEKATDFLEEAFRQAGLEPGGQEGSYRQCFDHPVSVKAEELALEVEGQSLPAQELSPAPFSSSADFAGEWVFGGYGIHAPEKGYDDYANLDPRDKVLLLLRYEPREKDPQSPLNGARPSRFSELRRKVFEAKRRGARAVVFTVPPRPGEKPEEKVAGLKESQAESQAGLPVLHLQPTRADALLKLRSKNLAELVASIDKDFASKPIALGQVKGRVRMVRQSRKLCNLVGVLPGRGPLAKESVVIGAHFDHLGFGQSGTMQPGNQALHPGADDNASGVAGVLSLAQYFAQLPEQNRRSLVFVTFNAEEVGIAGSSSYVKFRADTIRKTAAMLNLDMIGRLKDGRLMVMGTQTGDHWSDWLAQAARSAGLELATSGDGYGPSDHTPFYAREVPVLHFFTGAHPDHHRSSDTPNKLNYPGALQVLGLVAELAERAAQGTRIAYQETSAGPMLAGDGRSFGAWLGTVPDYTAMSPSASGGVLLSGVRKGGPADVAGLRQGDRIVAMAEGAIDNLYDMTFVLRDHRPGEVVQVTVVRDGQQKTLAATLGSRAEMGPPSGHALRRAGPHGHPAADGPKMDPKTLLYPGEEKHLKNLRQLTFGGENAEGYFSPDGSMLVFQARGRDVPCDRIYTLELSSGKIEQVSSGKGRTTCAYYTWPDGKSIFYSSTHLAGDECPQAPDHKHSRIWPVFESYDIFMRKPDGALQRLTDNPGYDAEATACFKDGRIVFTSKREGDLDLYLMDPKTPKKPPVRLTDTFGYDGGAYFSPDCSRLTWRAARPTGPAADSYRELLKQNLVKPGNLEIYVAEADGSQARQVTRNGAANFAPYFLPDNRRVIFSSNHHSRGRNFDLFVIDPLAEKPVATQVRITYSPVFESFPMFSPDGKKLVFASNRNGKHPGETNLFIADWLE